MPVSIPIIWDVREDSVLLGHAHISFHNQDEKSGASGFWSILLLPRFTYSLHNDSDLNKNILVCSVLAATYASYLWEREFLRNFMLTVVE